MKGQGLISRVVVDATAYDIQTEVSGQTIVTHVFCAGVVQHTQRTSHGFPLDSQAYTQLARSQHRAVHSACAAGDLP